MKKSKVVALAIILVMVLTVLSGCGKDEIEKSKDEFKSEFSAEGFDLSKVTIGPDNVPIPNGFYYVGGKKSTGLVISDTKVDENKGDNYADLKGNQFVWVPLDEINIGNEIIERLSTSDDYSNYRTEDELNEYIALQNSVLQYGGFYVSRYEMATKKNSKTVTNNPNESSRIRNISIEDAKDKSSEMYVENASVNSHLIYGAEWDAIMAWFANQEGNWMNYVLDDSNSLGLYKDNDKTNNHTNRRFLCLIFKTVNVAVKKNVNIPDGATYTRDGQGNYVHNQTLTDSDMERVEKDMSTFGSTLKTMSKNKIASVEVVTKRVDTPITKVSLYGYGKESDQEYYVPIEDIKAIVNSYLDEEEYTDIIIAAPLYGISSFWKGLGGIPYEGRSYSQITLWSGHPTWSTMNSFPEYPYSHEFIHHLETLAYWRGFIEAVYPEDATYLTQGDKNEDKDKDKQRIVHNGFTYGFPEYGSYVDGVGEKTEKTFQTNIYNSTLNVKEIEEKLPEGLPDYVYQTSEISQLSKYPLFEKIPQSYTFEINYNIYTQAQKGAIKNIYHMAGSLAEITQETFAGEAGKLPVVRGGSYNNSGNSKDEDGFAMAQRKVKNNTVAPDVGFRTCLYIEPTDKPTEERRSKEGMERQSRQRTRRWSANSKRI